MSGQRILFDNTLNSLKKNKELRELGKNIVIPTPFSRLNTEYPGIEQGTYVLCTGNYKSGKTQFTDALFLYNPIEFIMNNDTNIDVKIFYFTLEMSKFAKMRQAICRKLFIKKGIILSPRKIQSLFNNYILPDNILRFIEEDKEYFDFFEDHVEFIENTRNPFGIFKHVREFFHNNGTYISKTGEVIPIEEIRANTEEVNKSISYYLPNNPDLFVFIIIDHISLITEEKIDGVKQNLYDAIKKLSNDYLLHIRDKWKGIPVVVQQQTLEREGNDSIKLGTTEPSSQGLSDFKGTSKDASLMFSIYSPFRNKIKNYNGYDITILKDNYRRISIDFDRNGTTCETDVYFNGMVNYFEELPKPNEMASFYNKLKKNGI